MESYFLPPKGIFVSEWRFFIVKTWEGRFTTGIYGVETTEMLPKFYSAQDMPHTTREYPVQNVNSTALKKLWSSSSHICHPEYSMLHEGTNHSSAPNPPVPSYRTYHSYHCLQGARSSFHLWPLLLLTATVTSHTSSMLLAFSLLTVHGWCSTKLYWPPVLQMIGWPANQIKCSALTSIQWQNQ